MNFIIPQYCGSFMTLLSAAGMISLSVNGGKSAEHPRDMYVTRAYKGICT